MQLARGLLRYVLQPPLAQERVEHPPDGLVRASSKSARTGGSPSPSFITRCRRSPSIRAGHRCGA